MPDIDMTNVIVITRRLGNDVVTVDAVYDENKDCWLCRYVRHRSGPDFDASPRNTTDAWAELRDMLDCALDR